MEAEIQSAAGQSAEEQIGCGPKEDLRRIGDPAAIESRRYYHVAKPHGVVGRNPRLRLVRLDEGPRQERQFVSERQPGGAEIDEGGRLDVHPERPVAGDLAGIRPLPLESELEHQAVVGGEQSRAEGEFGTRLGAPAPAELHRAYQLIVEVDREFTVIAANGAGVAEHETDA